MASYEELKSAYETKVSDLQDAIKSVTAETTIENGNVTIPERAYEAAKELKSEIKQIENILKDGETKSFFEDWSHEGSEAAQRFAAPVAEFKSVAEMLLDSPEYKDMLETRRGSMRDDVSLEMRDITSRTAELKDVYTSMGSSFTPVAGYSPRGMGIVHQELPFVPSRYNPQRVRDLFPQASTTANLLEYFRSTGFAGIGSSPGEYGSTNPNNAAFISERANSAGTQPPDGTANDVFGLKPKSNIAFTSASTTVKTIAHWIPAHRNTLADRPAMQAIIDNELLWGLKLREDDALLNGTGTNDSLLGLLNTPGIQTYAGAQPTGQGHSALTDNWADNVRRAQTLVELAFYPSNGVVVHPYDWEKMELTKNSQGSYLLSTNVAVGATKTVWQIPVVSTPAIAQGTFLTGAFGQAAQVFDREQANIRVAEQHADFFVRNAIVILAEERLALAVQRPEGLVKGTFGTPTS